MLAAAHAANTRLSDILRLRITRACLASAALFAVSCVVPEPFRYLLWLVAIGIESGALLAEDREAARRARREHDFSALAPADPAERLDPHHFAERFGLFLIILIGEVVVEAGQASVDGHVATVGGWAALVAAMIVAGGLWWLYFDSAVEINLRVLELSGGSPTMARAIFAVGHQLPAFALLITAAGIGLLLEEDPPAIAAKLACLRHRASTSPARAPSSTCAAAAARDARPRARARGHVRALAADGAARPARLHVAARRLGRGLRRHHHPARARGRAARPRAPSSPRVARTRELDQRRQHLVPRRARELVADAVEDEQLGAGDRRGERLAVRGREERVVRAVDDEHGHGDLRRAARGRTACRRP